MNSQLSTLNSRPTDAIGYLRCSTLAQTNSIPTQFSMMKEYEKRGKFHLPDFTSEFKWTEKGPDGKLIEHSVSVPGTFHDYGVSAEKVPFLDRPSVIAMVHYMEDHDIRTIVCAVFDRMFRDTEDCLHTVKRLSSSGVGLIMLDIGDGDPVDTVSPDGELRLTMRAMCARFENRMRTKRVNDTIKYRKGLGRCCGEVGYGWRRPEDYENDGHDTLLPIEHEQSILHRLKEGDLSATAGITENEAARRLNDEGVRTKKGGLWRGSTIHGIRKTGRLAPEFQPSIQ